MKTKYWIIGGVILVILVVGGLLYYYKVYKPTKDKLEKTTPPAPDTSKPDLTKVPVQTSSAPAFNL